MGLKKDERRDRYQITAFPKEDCEARKTTTLSQEFIKRGFS